MITHVIRDYTKYMIPKEKEETKTLLDQYNHQEVLDISINKLIELFGESSIKIRKIEKYIICEVEKPDTTNESLESFMQKRKEFFDYWMKEKENIKDKKTNFCWLIFAI